MPMPPDSPTVRAMPPSSQNPEAALTGASPRLARRRRAGTESAAHDAVAEEVPVALSYNGVPFAVMMATPADLEDFALGFSVSEGIVEHMGECAIDAIETWVEGVSIALRIPDVRMDAMRRRIRALEGRSGCGVCGSQRIEDVLRPPAPVRSALRTSDAALSRALSELDARQPLNARTGATHAAAFADSAGALRLVREDVGRHNALDKLIGAMAQAGIDAGDGFALVTSRASYEMAMKAARAGIPMLAAISAPTTLAIALAESAGLTLVAFARAHGHAIYSHPQRLARGGDA
jgi:FdhD protein